MKLFRGKDREIELANVEKKIKAVKAETARMDRRINRIEKEVEIYRAARS
jgi:vacuolar-type H+-ATPase subunit D/Vma8